MGWERKMRNKLSMIAMGILSSVGNALSPTNDYNERSVKVMGYKTGGKPFTRGKRSRSLKVRANRGKAKAKAKKR